MTQQPYLEGVPQYAEAGWDGMIPVRRKTKTPALSDVTGYTGHQLTPEESLELSGKAHLKSCNLGLRLPRGLVGVDVDDYGDKHGGDTLRRLESELGELPPAPYSSARGPGVSGIRFFQVPEDLDFEHVFGPEIECIRFAHRFAVVHPSIHSKTGGVYRWYTPDNIPIEGVPSPGDFPPLPRAWVNRFGHEPRQRGERIGDFSSVEDFFHVHDTGEHGSYLESAKKLFDPGSGCRHDTMLKALGCAMRDAAAGMYPARDAVEQLHEIWSEATDGEGRDDEFRALVERACEDAATEEPHPYRKGIVNPGQTVSVLEEDGDAGMRTVLILESPKPERVVEASEFAPERVSVEWVRDFSKIKNFTQYANDTVYLASDKDPEKDLKTYQKLDEFRDDLETSGAGAVRFLSKPHRFLERVLAATPEDAPGVFSRSLDNIVPDTDGKGNPITPKPAKSKPRGSSRDDEGASQVEQRKKVLSDKGNRSEVELTGDRKIDNDNLIAGVKRRWDGKKVFNYGNAIARVKEDQVIPQNTSMWKNTLVEACKIVRTDTKGNLHNAEVPGYCVDSTLSRVDDFTVLEGIKHAPFVRADGTVCQEPGYDPESKMKLVLSENLSGIEVPENPTHEEVVEARKFLEEWLYDFFQIMPTPTDRANALALVLTPFIRGSVPVVPMCVVNGLQHGVGKNKFANGVATLYTGKPLIPKTFTVEDEEQRKQLMSIFREGSDFNCFDETHVVDGKALAQALTASTWSDRILGVSQIAEYPNNATWMSLGNNVRIEGDCVRRVYQVQLKPTSPNPENRTASDFRHPDFEEWTSEIRKDLLVAVLTVIRGWYAAGKPRPSKEASFGSFEIWESLIRGVLEYAGVEGFLDNQQEFRGSSSATLEYWIAHLEWLHEKFEDGAFSTHEVHAKLIQDQPNSEPPPGMEDLKLGAYTRELGKQYGRMKDRFIGEFQLVKVTDRRSRSNLWKVNKFDE